MIVCWMAVLCFLRCRPEVVALLRCSGKTAGVLSAEEIPVRLRMLMLTLKDELAMRLAG
jgi:hypothetical protein